MQILAALAALSAIGSLHGQAPQGEKLAGRQVELKFPAFYDEKPSAEYLSWSGWGFTGKSINPSEDMQPSLNWKPIQDALARISPSSAPFKWRTKIILFREVDTITQGLDGTFVQRRSSLEPTQIQEILEAILRFKALVTEESKGKLELVLDVSVEDQAMREEGATAYAGAPSFLSEYVVPRVNWGAYEPDDKVFRGPYQSIICIDPALKTLGKAAVEVKGQWVSDVYVFGEEWLPIEWRLFETWHSQFGDLARRRGLYVGGKEVGATGWSAPEALADRESWPVLASTEPNAAALPNDELDNGPYSLIAETFRSPNIGASLVPDIDRGKVLKYTEKGFERAGSLRAPGSSENLKETPFFSFWVRSKSRESLAIRLADVHAGDEALEIALGPDAPGTDMTKALPSQPGTVEAEFKPDGTWQHMVVDLSKTKLAGVTQMSIGPSHNAKISERGQIDPIEFYFDKFEFKKELAAGETLTPLIEVHPIFDSPREQDRVAWIKDYVAGPTPDKKTKAFALMADPSDYVRLNAVRLIGGLKDPESELMLTTNATYIDARISESALLALAALNTDTAWMTIRRMLTAGPTDLTRATAAKLLATRKDPNLAGPLVALMANRSWFVRKSAAEAIAQLPGKEAPLILTSFIKDTFEPDPEVRLAATRGADASIDAVASTLLYASVNDPSDMVRAWSDIKLIESGNEKSAREGYKGIRDDSRQVRLTVLGYLKDHPSDEQRKAVRLALTDSDAEVRANAVGVLGANPAPVTLEELSSVLQDKHPLVQSALLDLSASRKLALPKETLDLMKTSTDKRVVKRVQEMGG